MATHYTLADDDSAVALKLAQKALRTANGLSTARPGSVYIPNLDDDGFRDGTGTLIGSTGSVGNGGVAEWIGDTTVPGKPTGVSASSAWGVVYAKWDGTLEGGVPEDFAYVSVTVDGTEVGRLAEAGTVAADGYEDGATVTVGFTAYDAARDRRGQLAPNASETATVQLTVSDARAEIDEAVSGAEQAAEDAKQQAQEAWDRAEGVASDVESSVQEAKDAAQAAQEVADSLEGQLTDITTTVNGVQQSVDELTTTVSGAASTADAALAAATEAKQTATEISSTASQALETAEGALTQATEAKQTADSISATLESDYVSKTDADTTYATKTELEATSEGLTASIEETATTADAALKKATEVEATAEKISTTISSDYLSKADAEATYATQSSVEQTAGSISAEVSAAVSTADAAMEKASAVEQTVDGITEKVTSATETAESALAQASEAKQTVDGFTQTVSETYATKEELGSSIAQEALDRNSAIEQSATEIRQTVSETYQVKGDYLTATEADATYATQSSVQQAADSILSTVETTYVSQEDADATYASKTYVDQRDDSITSTVSTAQKTADDAYEKVSTVEQTVDGIEVRLTEAVDGIDDASKVATNYLSYSADGLVVADMTGDALGYNTRLTSSGMEVRNGETVLASYGESDIELGKSNPSATISMCGGDATVSMDTMTPGIAGDDDEFRALAVTNSSGDTYRATLLRYDVGEDSCYAGLLRATPTMQMENAYLSEHPECFAVNAPNVALVSPDGDHREFATDDLITDLGTLRNIVASFGGSDVLVPMLLNLSSCIKSSGDTMNAAGYYGGYITSSGTSLRFSLPCVFASGVKAEADGDWQMYVRADGGYEVGSANSATTIRASNIALTPRGHHIDVAITLSTARNNNIAVGVQVSSGPIYFS